MGLATLLNVPSTEQGWLEFSFSNSDSHTKILNAIYAKHGFLIGSYPLDPIPWGYPLALQTWARNHQQAHNEMNAFTGVSGADLTIGDLTRVDEVANFIKLHADEHILAEQILGVT